MPKTDKFHRFGESGILFCREAEELLEVMAGKGDGSILCEAPDATLRSSEGLLRYEAREGRSGKILPSPFPFTRAAAPAPAGWAARPLSWLSRFPQESSTVDDCDDFHGIRLGSIDDAVVADDSLA